MFFDLLILFIGRDLGFYILSKLIYSVQFWCLLGRKYQRDIQLLCQAKATLCPVQPTAIGQHVYRLLSVSPSHPV